MVTLRWSTHSLSQTLPAVASWGLVCIRNSNSGVSHPRQFWKSPTPNKEIRPGTLCTQLQYIYSAWHPTLPSGPGSRKGILFSYRVRSSCQAFPKEPICHGKPYWELMLQTIQLKASQARRPLNWITVIPGGLFRTVTTSIRSFLLPVLCFLFSVSPTPPRGYSVLMGDRDGRCKRVCEGDKKDNNLESSQTYKKHRHK